MVTGIDFDTFKNGAYFRCARYMSACCLRLTKDSATVWSLLMVYPMLVSIVVRAEADPWSGIRRHRPRVSCSPRNLRAFRGSSCLCSSQHRCTSRVFCMWSWCSVSSESVRTLTILCTIIALRSAPFSDRRFSVPWSISAHPARVAYFYNEHISLYTKAALIALVVLNVVIMHMVCRFVGRNSNALNAPSADACHLPHLHVFMCYMPLIIGAPISCD